MRILFITARPPWPGRRGDQARTAGLAEALASRHTIRVVAQQWPGFTTCDPPAGIEVDIAPISRPSIARGLFSAFRRPVQVALHDQPSFHDVVRATVADFQPDVAVVVLSRIGDVMEHLAGIPTVLDLVDALALNMSQRGVRQPFLQRFWNSEARRINSWDRSLLRRVRFATVVSERDRRILVGSDDSLSDVVRVVPFGLPVPRQDPMDVGRHPVVVLTGNLGYFPTIDGARWFGERVWPRVRRFVPEAEWWLAGARPAATVQRLARLPGVRLVPSPDNLESILRQGAVAIAPLKAGSGTPIKILEAMAARVPVVTTSAGRAGLDELPSDAIHSADTSEAFARAVVRLLEERELGHRTAMAAWRWLVGRHEGLAVAQYFERILVESLERRSRDTQDMTTTVGF